MVETFNEYSSGFDVDAYLSSRFPAPGQKSHEYEALLREFAVKNLHEYFSKKSLAVVEGTTEVTVLDYGCGPVIANVISAAGLASEITLAEYTKDGRTALQRWLDKAPSSFNWSPYFKYIVQTLEGKTLQEAEEREERLRRVVKAVVGCDVTQDQPIEKGYEGPYDVVICCLCLSTACNTKQEFSNAVRKIAGLIKPGGVFLYYRIESTTPGDGLLSYNIGDKKYAFLRLNHAFVQATLEQAEFSDITVKRLPDADPSKVGVFYIACK